MRLRLTLLLICLALGLRSCPAKEFSLGAQEESKMVDSIVVESPKPEIPEDFQDEAFKSIITARFNIAADGKFTVKLLESSGNEEIDKLVLSTLRKWKFKPATLDDKPVASKRKLKIELEVE